MEAKPVSRELAHMHIDHVLSRLAYLCTGGNRTLTTDEKWMLEHTINDLMNAFTGYTIEYPSTHEECNSGQTDTFF